MQDLSWDDKLPDDLVEQWYRIRKELEYLNTIKIPRCVRPPKTTALELHVFCDASEMAYAAVVYIRARGPTGISCKLLTSKTKVAPVKALSMPRLELCAATLGGNLTNSLRQTLEVSLVTAWTDSTIVLNWLSKLPRTWNTFVANRVATVQEEIPRNQWKYVPSKDNPADMASRGLLASEIIANALWWNGPEWLSADDAEWPLTPSTEETLLEKRLNKSICTVVTQILPLNIEKFSSLQKLFRVFGYVLRFIAQVKVRCGFKIQSSAQVSDSLTAIELGDASYRLVSYEQQKLLKEEFSLLQQGGELPKNSPYISLCPFFDKDFNVIRVGGRLANSDYDSLKKFPLLLPKTSSLVPLIIRYFHEATLHGGDSMTLAALRETYWIIGVRIMIRKIIKNCIKCCRFSLKSTTQQMADLPLERITPSRPFSQSGLDFAGPLKVKCSGKVYIAIFVCLSTKAVHMELVGNLSKDACILALKRFFARRGTPSKILSDNGTNFIGARNDLLKLNEVFESKNKDSVVSFAEQRGTEWVTIPPRAPILAVYGKQQ